MEPFLFGMSIEFPGAGLGGSGCGDRDGGLLPGCCPLARGAELGRAPPTFGEARPEPGKEDGVVEPDTEALLVRRQSFLILFTLMIELCLPLPFTSSDANESTENRLDGADDTLLMDRLLWD